LSFDNPAFEKMCNILDQIFGPTSLFVVMGLSTYVYGLFPMRIMDKLCAFYHLPQNCDVLKHLLILMYTVLSFSLVLTVSFYPAPFFRYFYQVLK